MIKILENINLSVILYGCETSSVTLGAEEGAEKCVWA
jgi:maleate cis-trans isomerase